MRNEPIREWREQFARPLCNIDFEPLPGTPFRASFKLGLDPLPMARCSLSPGFKFRDKELVKDGNDAFSLFIARSRRVTVTHWRRDLELDCGEATLLHVCETGRIGSHRDFSSLCLMIPRSELTLRGDIAVMRHIPRNCETLQLLRGYLGGIEKALPGLSGEARETVRRHIIDLVTLSCTPHGALGESSASAIVAARLTAALTCIAAHFQDPGLCVAAVARSQGISARYLQSLLEMSGGSFTERVSDLRLQRAFALLTDTGDGPHRISDIALLAGFSDISYFNRLFRARFGDTPSAVRAQATARQRAE